MAQRLDVQYIQFYTDGSAARKAAPVEPFKTLRLPKIKKTKPKVLRIDLIATMGILMSAVMLIMLIVGVVQLNAAQQEATVMEQYVRLLEQKNASLETDYAEKLNLEDVKQTALALGLVPVEQVEHVTLQLPVEEKPETPGGWERFCTFLAGLFA